MDTCDIVHEMSAASFCPQDPWWIKSSTSRHVRSEVLSLPSRWFLRYFQPLRIKKHPKSKLTFQKTCAELRVFGTKRQKKRRFSSNPMYHCRARLGCWGCLRCLWRWGLRLFRLRRLRHGGHGLGTKIEHHLLPTMGINPRQAAGVLSGSRLATERSEYSMKVFWESWTSSWKAEMKKFLQWLRQDTKITSFMETDWHKRKRKLL